MAAVRLGKGSFGEVFAKDATTVTKMCEFIVHTGDNKSFELTTITELAILCKFELENNPRFIDVGIQSSGKVAIDMENCGQTLLQYAKTLRMEQRLALLPKIAFQLIEAALALQQNGIIHNDIKSANVMVTNEGNIKLIDFGLCAFEVINNCDANLIAPRGTTMNQDWGTYTICPPETFIWDTWSVEKYMPWSIGITLCEFLFKTHSFVYDYVLASEERPIYRKHYTDDWEIRQIFAKIYMSRISSKVKSIVEPLKLENNAHYTSDITNMFNMMLALNYDERLSLQQLYMLPMFDSMRARKINVKENGILPCVFSNIVDAPICSKAMQSRCRNKRAKVIRWMFDALALINKLNIFVNAVHMFDRYCACVAVDVSNYYTVAISCIYLSQHIHKRNAHSVKCLIDSLTFTLNKQPNITVSATITTIEDILFNVRFDIYFQTFDVIVTKKHFGVDMNAVLKVLTSCPTPYNNDTLISLYMDYTRMQKMQKMQKMSQMTQN